MGVTEPPPGRGRERRDLSLNVVVLFLATLVVAAIIVHFVAIGTYDYLARQPSPYPPPSPLAGQRAPVVGPRLLVNQALDMAQLRAAEDALLDSYGWVDRAQGIVRVPVARAIELLAQRGLPTNLTVQAAPP